MCSNPWENVWSFSTARFRVTLDVAPEDSDPADSFQFDEDAEFARDGGSHWFQARIRVAFVDHENPKNWAQTRERVLGEDYLGACSYASFDDFRTDPYFYSLVAEALSEARGTLRRIAA